MQKFVSGDFDVFVQFGICGMKNKNKKLALRLSVCLLERMCVWLPPHKKTISCINTKSSIQDTPNESTRRIKFPILPCKYLEIFKQLS